MELAVVRVDLQLQAVGVAQHERAAERLVGYPPRDCGGVGRRDLLEGVVGRLPCGSHGLPVPTEPVAQDGASPQGEVDADTLASGADVVEAALDERLRGASR